MCVAANTPPPPTPILTLSSPAPIPPIAPPIAPHSDNSDLIACMVVTKDGGQAQRFLAVDVYQMSLVEPDSKRLGWGVVKFAGLLQVLGSTPAKPGWGGSSNQLPRFYTMPYKVLTF